MLPSKAQEDLRNRVGGAFAPSSHTTVRTVFRIRRFIKHSLGSHHFHHRYKTKLFQDLIS